MMMMMVVNPIPAFLRVHCFLCVKDGCFLFISWDAHHSIKRDSHAKNYVLLSLDSMLKNG